MRVLRRVMLARRVLLLGVLFVVGTGLGLLSAHGTIRIDLNPLVESHVLPASALITVAVAACGATISRPRLYSWERIGARGRASTSAAAVAVVGILASLAPAIGPLIRWPDEMARGWLIADSLVLACAIYVLGALISPLLAGGVVAVAFLAHGVAYNVGVVPDVVDTLSGIRADVSWYVPVILLTLTVVVHASTRGATTFAHRLGRNEH
ncbi:hypothetical protein [Phytoactinopolyspora limicola]|uniref:hypothetical protein n=1 Tax=Phytoactinopolyspora limicola TaxID=2715536 RepID=UPI00140BEDE2|nr:hypothetical protein [Phytoactinopolyspora limicola]